MIASHVKFGPISHGWRKLDIIIVSRRPYQPPQSVIMARSRYGLWCDSDAGIRRNPQYWTYKYLWELWENGWHHDRLLWTCCSSPEGTERETRMWPIRGAGQLSALCSHTVNVMHYCLGFSLFKIFICTYFKNCQTFVKHWIEMSHLHIFENEFKSISTSYHNISTYIFIMYLKKRQFSSTQLDSQLHVDHLAAPTAVKNNAGQSDLNI